MLKIDLKDHICEPPEGGGQFTTLERISQDLRDLECLDNELTELAEHVDDSTGEKALNLSLALDVTQTVRGCLSRALCLLVSWAPKVGESTIVEVDDTPKKFIQATLSPPAEINPNTISPKGRN